jgi:myo-inositol 2-dehydrogenase / D-chiro-inositol 1-dehydrogenase
MNAPARLTAGIIGAGWIGRQHGDALAMRDDVVVGAVCDVDPTRATELGGALGAQVFTDWQGLLDAGGLDVVWICTPPRSHRDPTLAAFELGIPVYLEKPVARTLDDARAIAGAALERRIVCAVGYQWHAVEVLDDLRARLEGQSIGYLLGQSIGPTAARSWFLDRAAGGGNLLERGSHQIDLVRTIGGEVRSAQAAASKVALGGSDAAGGDIDDAVTIVLQLESGALATIAVAWTRDGLPGTYSVDVIASDGRYRLDLDPDFRLSGSGAGKGGTAGGTVDVVSTEHPFQRSVSRFLEAVRVGDPNHVFCTPADATRTLAVAAAAEQALASGQTVTVENP